MILIYAKVLGRPVELNTRHFIASGPPNADGSFSGRIDMETPTVVYVEQAEDGIFLYRYARGQAFGGDTFHLTVEEAKKQAEWEYEGVLGPWTVVPEGTADPLAFVLS